MKRSEQIFLFFHGQWQLDRSTNAHGTMKGIASFLPLYDDPLTLLYQEDGEHITRDGTSCSFFKEYIYCLNEDFLDVYFSYNKKKGELFHRLLVSGTSKDTGLATGEHYCNQDIYRATYQFYAPNRFTLEYDIQGPKKNLKIQTLFLRAETPLK